MSDQKPLCLIPWVHLHTWPNGNVYPCCVTPMEYIVGNLKENSLEEIFNSDMMKKIRKDLLSGVKTESCERCWSQEERGGHSMRMRANESWKHHEKDIIARTNPDGSVENMKLPYWDFRFSNICNFKCRSCGPQLSSGWYNDTKKIALLETGKAFLPEDVPTDRNFELWEQIEPHFDTVEEIYFAGGEPLIMEEHYRILKKLDEMGKYDVLIRYNTNFSEMRYKDMHVLDFWKKFKNVEVGASIDGMDKEGEYIRSGFKWEQFVKNREEMKEKCPHVNFYVTCTTSIQNAYHIVPFHHRLVEDKLIDNYDRFFVNIVTEPPMLDMRLLPQWHKEFLSEAYRLHSNFLSMSSGLDNQLPAINARRGFISLRHHLLQDHPDQRELISGGHNLLRVFKYKMKQLDEIRGESFAETFPEMKDLMDCE